jgi:mRNA interferase MazF
MKTEAPHASPKRGELYIADPGQTIGHEQAGRRPYLVISVQPMNRSPLRMVIAVPVTTTDWTNPLHVRIEPAASGLPRVSYAMPEMARSISQLRLRRRVGRVPIETVDAAAKHTGVLIGLGRARF